MIAKAWAQERFALSIQAKSLILSAFLFAFGSYMVTPYLAIFFEEQIGLSESSIGLVVGAMTLIQFGGGVVGGKIAESIGLKTGMLMALSFRVIGFSLLAISVSHHALVVPAALLVAFAPAIYLPANRAYLLHECAQSHARSWILSLANAALNAGMSLGPLVAASYFSSNASAVLFSAAVLFAVTALFHLRLREVFPAAKSVGESSVFTAAIAVRKPLFFSAATYYVYFHFQSFMGLYMKELFDTKTFSWLLFLNFTILIIVQPLASKKIERSDYGHLLALGFASLSAGFLIMSRGTLAGAVLGTVLMTFGQALLFLRSDLEILETSKLSPALAFGLQRLTVGIGGALGSAAAGLIFQLCKTHNDLPRFWMYAALQAFVFGLLAFFFRKERA